MFKNTWRTNWKYSTLQRLIRGTTKPISILSTSLGKLSKESSILKTIQKTSRYTERQIWTRLSPAPRLRGSTNPTSMSKRTFSRNSRTKSTRGWDTLCTPSLKAKRKFNMPSGNQWIEVGSGSSGRNQSSQKPGLIMILKMKELWMPKTKSWLASEKSWTIP